MTDARSSSDAVAPAPTMAPRAETSAQSRFDPDASAARALPPAASSRQASATSSARQGKAGTYIVIGCVIALVALGLLGSLLNVGDHLSAAHPALGWAFYLIIAVLVAVGIVVPVVKVARRPIFSLYQLRDESGHAKRRRCQMLVDNLVENTGLTDDEVRELQGYLNAGDDADDLIIAFFTEHCVPPMIDQTKRSATTAFFVSAISHSPLVNSVTMLSISLDLVRAIVEQCGFRPTTFGLARLYARVMVNALIIGGIEDSDLSDLLGQLMGGGAGARAGGIVIGAAAEGLVSAFLVFRVGVITRRWLTAADGPERMATMRRASYREALSLMRSGDFMATVADYTKKTAGTVAASMAANVSSGARSVAHSTAEAAKSMFSRRK